MNLFNRKYIMIYIVSSVLTFTIGHALGESQLPITINNIHSKDIIYI